MKHFGMFLLLVGACGSVNELGGDASPDEIDAATGPDAACLPTEILDGQDNDCDAVVDEGFWSTVFVTAHSVLAAYESTCDSQAAVTANPYECHIAARAECAARGYPAGFRPVESDASNVGFVCVADVALRTVDYATLAGHVSDCSAVNAYRGQCFTAIHRYCRAQGFTTGIGPLNNNPSSSVEVACSKHASITSLTFDQLRTADATCDLPSGANPWDFSCFRAYHRHCWQAGLVTAWGPLEYNQVSNYVEFACLPSGPAI